MTVERLEQYRKQMPAAEKYIYMNSAGCGPMPIPVREAMESVFARMTEEGQVNVEIHGWLKELLEEVRRDVADFIHADPGEIFFVRCIAEGLNTISRMFAWEKGDSVLITDQENPASFLPFFAAEPILNCKVDTFCALGDKESILDQFLGALTGDTKMTVVSHVLHTTGAAVPAKEMCQEAETRGIITVLDGAQAAGNIAINVRELGCGFYLLSCHKWLCGPEGIAAVYIRRDLIDRVRVPFGGVGMENSFDFKRHTIQLKPDARRFEFGGRHIPMYAAFSKTIEFAGEIGFDVIAERMQKLHRYCRAKFLSKIPQTVIISPEDERLRTGIFSFYIPGMNHREAVKLAWKEKGIIIQWRVRDLITREESIRVSLNWFIRESEIDQLVEEFQSLAERKI